MNIFEQLQIASDTAIIIFLVILIVTILLVIAIFNTERNTSNTEKLLRDIKKQNEYICQALNYIINNDGNFRADKPQYIPKPKKEPNALEKLFGMKR